HAAVVDIDDRAAHHRAFLKLRLLLLVLIENRAEVESIGALFIFVVGGGGRRCGRGRFSGCGRFSGRGGFGGRKVFGGGRCGRLGCGRRVGLRFGCGRFGRGGR